MRSPEKRSSYVHFTEITTRWNDNDVYGHVNNVMHYLFFDTAVNKKNILTGALDPQSSPIIGLVVRRNASISSSSPFPMSCMRHARHEVGPEQRALRDRAVRQ